MPKRKKKKGEREIEKVEERSESIWKYINKMRGRRIHKENNIEKKE